RGIVPEFEDLHMAIERLLDDAALDAAAAAVHEAYFVEAGGRSGVDVFGNHRRNIARRECMQIDLALDRHSDSHQSQVTSGQSLSPQSPRDIPPSPRSSSRRER